MSHFVHMQTIFLANMALAVLQMKVYDSCLTACNQGTAASRFFLTNMPSYILTWPHFPTTGNKRVCLSYQVAIRLRNSLAMCGQH